MVPMPCHGRAVCLTTYSSRDPFFRWVVVGISSRITLYRSHTDWAVMICVQYPLLYLCVYMSGLYDDKVVVNRALVDGWV